ncbi:MAG: threonine ammonia-lyase [Pseudobdellovibrionaceae bacterium]
MKVNLEDIRQARKVIESFILPTDTSKSISASKLLGSEVFFKYENQQYTGSFKIRGALNKISSLSADEKKRGVVASSAGNHAQGVALSATRSGVRSTIVMPIHAPLVKVQATKDYGAEVVLKGEIYDEAYEHARKLEKDHGFVFVHPYEDEKIIAGQGTIGLEVLEKVPDLDSLVVPIGGGGLISGIATAAKALNPKIKIFGVQSNQAPGMEKLFHHQRPEEPKKRIATIADGIAIKKPSVVMYESFISKLVDEVVTVTDDEIAEAIVFLMERAKTVCEGSGAAGVAAIMNRKLNLGSKTCVILCGGNIDLNIIAKVVTKGLIRKGRLAELSIVVDDMPGNLNRLTKTIADLGGNVLEVKHDRLSEGLLLRETKIDFVLETTSEEHALQIRKALTQSGGRII